jgi:hypothetical protein
MASNYPGSLDNGTTLPDPSSSSTTNSPSHSSMHSNENAAIKAVEAKLGIGSSTPIANSLLTGTGTGTSAWSQVTSSNLAASVTDETGTGSLVFATTPTLLTPKVDTINENTSTNGVTIDGLNIKDNKLNTNDSVVTTNITDGNVTGSKLATTAISLGYASTTTAQTGITAEVDATSLSSAVTVPAGGRNVKVSGTVSYANTNASAILSLRLKEGSTLLKTWTIGTFNTSNAFSFTYEHVIIAPSAGPHTYKLTVAYSASGQLYADSATKYINDILVEAI